MKVKCPNCKCEFTQGGAILSKPRRTPDTDKCRPVLSVYAELTGIGFEAVVPTSVREQAYLFAKHFTFEDLDLVVTYTKWGMGDGKLGFNAQSLSWRKLMQDGFALFQERRDNALAALKRREFRFSSRFIGNDRRPQAPKTPAAKPVSAPKNPEEEEAIRRQAAEGFKKFQL